MSRLHATLADRRPEGEIERISCRVRVRLSILERKANARLAALSVPVTPVAASCGKSKQRKLRSHRASRSSLNPAWRDQSCEPANF